MADETKKGIRTRIGERLDAVFAKIGNLKRLHRILICVLTLALIGVGYYYLIYEPRSKALNAAKKSLAQHTQKLANYRRQARAVAEYEKKLTKVQEAFTIAMKALPDKKELPELLTGVSKAGANAGLEFLLFQPALPVNKDFYKEIPLSMQVLGSYHQMADFFYQVAGLSRIVNIRNMDVASSSRSPGMVQVNCSAVTYMFSEPAENKGKKKK